MKLETLRKKHKRFVYESFAYRLTKRGLEIAFAFLLEPNITFHPKITIRGMTRKELEKIPRPMLENFIFHLGLAEIPSYWKCAVSPEILIEAGPLDNYQKQWWKQLLFDGLGEFFYKNKIDAAKPGFVTIRAGANAHSPLPKKPIQGNSFLVPVGGGKDSLVALELLKRAKKKFQPLVLGNVPAAFALIKAARSPSSLDTTRNKPLLVRREVDPNLLALNRRGYLNGHTPFSAYLAFMSVFCAELFGHRYVAVANERSANEENITFHGKPINHQYSKSFIFEKTFREYAARYLTKNVSYVSVMRPLYELQIARIAASQKYLPAIKSCNVNQKKGTWCGKCSKCLAVFLLLYPFANERMLIDMFGRNLYADMTLSRYIPALVGKSPQKPFECVATREETRAALQLAIEKAQNAERHLPVLLERYRRTLLPRYRMKQKTIQKILRAWDVKNFLPKELQPVLRAMLSQQNS